MNNIKSFDQKDEEESWWDEKSTFDEIDVYIGTSRIDGYKMYKKMIGDELLYFYKLDSNNNKIIIELK